MENAPNGSELTDEKMFPQIKPPFIINRAEANAPFL
jgi:hypothetical protein